MVTVTFADGSTAERAVTWDAVDPQQYATAGQFTVTGDLGAGVSVRATAVVTVMAPIPDFADVVDGQAFYDEIRWMADRGLSQGTQIEDEVFFYPNSAVSRQAMAAFIYRYMAPTDFEAPATPTFSDVMPDDQFYEAIEWMAAERLAGGYENGTFGPTNPVSRQAMAAFLHRLADRPDAATPSFTDVPAGHDFAEAIGWLEETGIAAGYADNTFRMSDSITRQAMAAFLYRYDQFMFRPARAGA